MLINSEKILGLMFVRTIFRMLLKYVSPPLSDYSDARLLNSIRRNDQEAFEVIFERYWAPLFDFVFVRVQSVDMLREIVQDVFISLWFKRGSLPKNNLRSYLYEDADSRSLNYLAEPFRKSLEKSATRKTFLDRDNLEYGACRRDLKNV